MKSSAFDEYTFSIRHNIVEQELQNALLNTAITNSKTRRYEISKTTNNEFEEEISEMVVRKKRKTEHIYYRF